MKRFLLMLLVAVLLTSVCVCSADDDTFRIGFMANITYDNGVNAQNAVMLYIKELNERGGLLGKKVEAVYYDDAMNAEEAVKIASKIIEKDDVDFMINSTISNCVLATGQMFEDAGIPFFAMGFSKSLTEQGWKHCVRPTVNSSRSIPYLTTVMKEFGFKSVAIFQGQDDYGYTAGLAMKESCEKDGIIITDIEDYASGDTDFSGQVARILQSNPDCVFLGVLGGEAGNAIKQFRQFGYDGILFYSEPLQKGTTDISGEASQHVVCAFPYVVYQDIDDCTNPRIHEFLEKYYNEYGTLPTGEAAYREWDAMTVLEEAVNRAGSDDRDAILEAIYSIKDFEALGGTMDFTKRDGECLDAFQIWVWVDGRDLAYEAWKETEDYAEYSKYMGWN